MPYVGTILAGVQLFFLTISNFVASPLNRLRLRDLQADWNILRRQTEWIESGAAVSGNDIHPPNLYSGYTGFTIPFAFALAALLARYPGEKWIHLTRKWTMIAWCFSNCRHFARGALGLCSARWAATGAGIRWRMRPSCRG